MRSGLNPRHRAARIAASHNSSKLSWTTVAVAGWAIQCACVANFGSVCVSAGDCSTCEQPARVPVMRVRPAATTNVVFILEPSALESRVLNPDRQLRRPALAGGEPAFAEGVDHHAVH